MAMTPLAGVQVGLTRPEAGELAERLTALGATVVHVPLIEIAEPADGGLALRRALARLDAFDWLVVTSANGARRVGGAARRHPGLRLAAVGPATAAALEAEAGRPADLVPVLAQAEGLLGEFPAARARVLLAQADRARPVLADGLATAGHLVETVVAYRTVSRRPTADGGRSAERRRCRRVRQRVGGRRMDRGSRDGHAAGRGSDRACHRGRGPDPRPDGHRRRPVSGPRHDRRPRRPGPRPRPPIWAGSVSGRDSSRRSTRIPPRWVSGPARIP